MSRSVTDATDRFAVKLQSDAAGSPVLQSTAGPPASKRRRLPTTGLISLCVAIVPTTILLVLWWLAAIRGEHAFSPTAGPSATGLGQTVQGTAALEIALSSVDRIEAKPGEEIAFPIAIDATGKLPSRSVIAVSAMPDGAEFSEGRPYGATGWSFRPDEIVELRFRIPEARSGAYDIRLELLASDGAVLDHSETRLNVVADPAAERGPLKQTARLEVSNHEASPPSQPRQSSARTEPSVKVRTVKVVTVQPPAPKGPHDGALALGEAADPPAEWMEIVRPVNMHTRPRQSSKTVKVAQMGIKLRITARDKGWVQVSDPATSANGWIYSRFLKPTQPPGQ